MFKILNKRAKYYFDFSVYVLWLGLIFQTLWLLWGLYSKLFSDAELIHGSLDLLVEFFFLMGYSMGNFWFGFALVIQLLLSRALDVWFLVTLGYSPASWIFSGLVYLAFFLILLRGFKVLCQIKQEQNGSSFRIRTALVLFPCFYLIGITHLRFVDHVRENYISEFWIGEDITAEMIQNWKERFKFLREDKVYFYSHTGFLDGSEVFGIVAPGKVYSVYSSTGGPEVTVFDSSRIKKVQILEDSCCPGFETLEVVPTWGDPIHLYYKAGSGQGKSLKHLLELWKPQ